MTSTEGALLFENCGRTYLLVRIYLWLGADSGRVVHLEVILRLRPPQDRDWSGRAMARSALRMMPTFPSPSLKFRTAGFPQYGFKAGVSDRACPVGAPRVARFASVLRAPCCIREIPVLCQGRMRIEAPPFEQPQPLYPRGPRSEAGFAVPLHLHLSGPIRPTHRHISTSPLRGPSRVLIGRLRAEIPLSTAGRSP